MAQCSFCKSEVPIGTGMKLFKNDGKILLFCSSKCENATVKLKRDPRRYKWASKPKVAKK